MKLILILNYIIKTLSISCPNNLDWDYGAKGPEIWPLLDKSCDGQSQSPISIKSSEAKFNPKLKSFELLYDNKWIEFEAVNKRLSIYFMPVDKRIITVEGSTLTERHILETFWFTWGENNFQGSEHRIDNSKLPLEMKMLFRTGDNKSHIVLSFLFKISPFNNPNLDEILEAVIDARDEIGKGQLKIRFDTIISDDLGIYYQYKGSFTNPPCKEDVLVNVFPKLIPISAYQMKVFRLTNIKHNFRPLQELNGRTVEASFIDNN